MKYIIKDLDKMTGQEIRDCAQYVVGSDLPHEQKLESLNILLDEINARAKKISKKYNKRHYPFTLEDLNFKEEK